MTVDAATLKEIREGAWTTPGGDPAVRLVDTDEGNCGYCGHVVYGQHIVTASGMTQAVPGQALVWLWERGRFVPWHEECLAWRFDWTMNPNGTIHMRGCRHIQVADEKRNYFHGTRGEARHVFYVYERFCGTCAPLDRWLEAA